MECSSCGALIEAGIERCSECAAGLGDLDSTVAATTEADTPSTNYQSSKLIAFPGVSRAAIPQWRKELSERVREVQEKRAREDALELGVMPTSDETIGVDSSPQLELLPQSESTPVNPLVAAALRRIERAHEATYISPSQNLASVAAVAYAAPVDFESELSVSDPVAMATDSEPQLRPEKSHNLVMVPASAAKTETPAAGTETVEAEAKPKPRRMIGDLNDPALNYLDSVRTATHVETSGHRRASIFARLVSAFLDLVVVALLCAPFAAGLELTNTNWQDFRVWIFCAGVFSIVGFLYFTISTALTGRTLGLRLLSLRVVDARTGLIPTGTQSAGRALIYLASLLILGITSIVALMNPDRLTAHDRLTRTAVVHV